MPSRTTSTLLCRGLGEDKATRTTTALPPRRAHNLSHLPPATLTQRLHSVSAPRVLLPTPLLPESAQALPPVQQTPRSVLLPLPAAFTTASPISVSLRVSTKISEKTSLRLVEARQWIFTLMGRSRRLQPRHPILRPFLHGTLHSHLGLLHLLTKQYQLCLTPLRLLSPPLPTRCHTTLRSPWLLPTAPLASYLSLLCTSGICHSQAMHPPLCPTLRLLSSLWMQQRLIPHRSHPRTSPAPQLLFFITDLPSCAITACQRTPTTKAPQTSSTTLRLSSNSSRQQWLLCPPFILQVNTTAPSTVLPTRHLALASRTLRILWLWRMEPSPVSMASLLACLVPSLLREVTRHHLTKPRSMDRGISSEPSLTSTETLNKEAGRARSLLCLFLQFQPRNTQTDLPHRKPPTLSLIAFSDNAAHKPQTRSLPCDSLPAICMPNSVFFRSYLHPTIRARLVSACRVLKQSICNSYRMINDQMMMMLHFKQSHADFTFLAARAKTFYIVWQR